MDVVATGASAGDAAAVTRMRVALVGAGRGARELYAPAILQNPPSFHLRVIWSRSRASAEAFNLEVAGNSLEVFFGEDGLTELLARSDIEGYVVVLPSYIQLAFVTRLLQAGKRVLSEGPVAANRAGAQQALQLIEQPEAGAGVWMSAGCLRHEHVFLPSTLMLNELGPIAAAEVHAAIVVANRFNAEGVLRSDEELWVEGGVQHIAVLRQLLGPVGEVNCSRASDSDQQSPEDEGRERNAFASDSLSGTLKFESGAICALSWHTSENPSDERFRLALWGSRGGVEVELDTSPQAVAAGLQRFTLRRSIGAASRRGGAATLPASVASVGAELQLEAWANGARQEPATPDRSALHAVVDLIVVGAMLQSGGSIVQIREKQGAKR